VLDQVKYRVDWAKYQEMQKRKEEEALERERGKKLDNGSIPCYILYNRLTIFTKVTGPIEGVSVQLKYQKYHNRQETKKVFGPVKVDWRIQFFIHPFRGYMI